MVPKCVVCFCATALDNLFIDDENFKYRHQMFAIWYTTKPNNREVGIESYVIRLAFHVLTENLFDLLIFTFERLLNSPREICIVQIFRRQIHAHLNAFLSAYRETKKFSTRSFLWIIFFFRR